MEIQAAKGWQLMVRHRAGSLQAAVAQVRTRNLLVSMGILLVLATSLVVFAVAVRQARRLARQQVEFVASISHELRTPVTAICSLSENLADGLVRPEEQVQRYGQFMLREGRRLGSLVEQALEFAGVSSGRRRNHMQLLPVASVLREALQSCEASMQDAKSQVKMLIEPELPQIQADAESLRCALQNLITNAIKYSPGGSTISIQASYCRERRRLEIEVADEGMGIPKDELTRIFEPFYRGRIAVDMQIRGAGIGLSLVKRIVEAHQGRVEISSREGKGTRVTVSLPVPENDVPHGDAVEKGH
jgi:signal transduction histidine kinase